MSFLQSPYLIGAAAIVIPIVVHLIFRRQAQLVEIGSIRFLRDVVQQNRRKRTIAQWLLLLLRMAAVCLLAILFARPYLVSSERVVAREQFVILVDRSATMQLQVSGERLVDRAKRLAADLVRQAGRGVTWDGADFDHDVYPWSGMVKEGEIVPPTPANLTGGTRFTAALAWGLDRLKSGARQGGRIHLLTDLQRSGIDVDDLGPWPADVRVEIHDVGKDSAANLAVTSAATAKPVVRPGDPVTWEVNVLNTGSVAVENVPVRLILTANGETRRLSQEVTVPGEQSEQVKFELSDLGEGLWTGEINLDAADDLVVDNRRLIAVLVQSPVPVAILDGEAVGRAKSGSGAEAHSGAQLLQKALSLSTNNTASGLSPYAVVVVSSDDEAGWSNSRSSPLIVLSDVGELPRGWAEELADRVKSGTGLLILSGPDSTAEACRGLMDVKLIPGQLVGQAESREFPFRLRYWSETHAVFDPFRDPQYGDLKRLGFRGHARLAQAVDNKNDRVLATFQDGDPAIVERRLGEGRILWLATDCGQEWGAWVRSRLFVPLVHQLAGDLLGLTGEGPVVFRHLGAADAGLSVGITTTGPGQGESLATTFVARTLVTNITPQESETERCTPGDLATRYGFALDEEPADSATTERRDMGPPTTATELRDDELWPRFAGLLLLVLGLELFLGNRTTR